MANQSFQRGFAVPNTVFTAQETARGDITKDIQSMTTFRNHSAEIMRHVKETKRPVILTANCKAAAVLQDAEAYHRFLDLAAEVSSDVGIRQGQEDYEAGRTRPADTVFRELRAKYDIPG